MFARSFATAVDLPVISRYIHVVVFDVRQIFVHVLLAATNSYGNVSFATRIALAALALTPTRF